MTGQTTDTTEKAYGHNGTIFRIEDASNNYGAYKIVLVKRDDGKIIPGMLYGKAMVNFEGAGFNTGDEIRIFGPYKGSFPMVTAEYGTLDVQAVRVTWAGKPDKEKAKAYAKKANEAPQGGTTSAPAKGGSAWDREIDDEIPF